MSGILSFLIILMLHTGLLVLLPLCNFFRCALEVLCFFFAAPFALVVVAKKVFLEKDLDGASKVVFDWSGILSCIKLAKGATREK